MTQPAAIPVMDFYEEPRPPLDTLVHCEPLLERSQQHRFTIRPHRHNGLLQLFFVQQGRGTAWLDGQLHEVIAPGLLVVPDMCVHSFDWSEDIAGQVVSVVSLAVEQLETRLGEHLELVRVPQLLTAAQLSPVLVQMMDALGQEYLSFHWRREVVLLELVHLLLLHLERGYRAERVAHQVVTDRSGQHLLKFTRLVNEHFQEHWPVQRYASELGLTSQHLNAICRQLQGQSALQLVHRRLLLEARRYLSYTTLTVSEIGYQLGFADPSYFTRFFRRCTGEVPQAFRRQAWSHPQAAQAAD